MVLEMNKRKEKKVNKNLKRKLITNYICVSQFPSEKAKENIFKFIEEKTLDSFDK